jgi:hypothetical protein
MVVDKMYMKELRKCYSHGEVKFTSELEQLIYDRLGTEPEPYQYTEQDLHEQVRELVTRYQTPKGRLELVHGLDQSEEKIQSTENDKGED